MADLPDRILLEPALEAARRALRNLDEDDVPARLRKVAASSARRLPGPFADSLAAVLDADERLRELALEAWPDADPEDADPCRAASAVFLLRPAGWRRLVAGLGAMRERTETAAREAGAEARRERLEERIAVLEARLAEARERAASAEEAARAERREAFERLSASVSDLRRRLAGAELRAAAATERAGRAEADLVEADARIGVLRDRLLRVRRSEEAPGPRSGPVGRFGRGDPVGMARMLDQLVESLRPAGGPERTEAIGRELRLPTGIRPDRAEAVEWVLRSGIPLTLVVDGYNVAHVLDPDPGPATRARVVHALGRIRRLADGPVRAVVFWDSADEPDARDEGGVRIRFVPDADAAVVAEVETAGGAVVAVSADRQVRERAEEAGAVGLWSDALLDWMGAR